MKRRLPYVALLIAALAAWWIGDHVLVPWVQRVAGYDRIQDRDLSVLLGHWVFGQLPRVLVCVGVWLVGTRLGLMPPLGRSLGSGGSWLRVITTGLIATVMFLVLTVVIGAAAGGKFGFHPYFPKMAGDLVSNMYEEIVYRGLMFCAFYGVAAAACFPLAGKLDRAGVVAGTIGSCAVFAAGHDQFSRLSTNEWPTPFGLARAYATSGNKQKALEHGRLAIKQAPGEPARKGVEALIGRRSEALL